MSRLQLCNWTSLDFVNSTWHSFFGKPINHLNIIDGASNAHFFCPWIDSQATVLTRSHCIFPLKYAMFVHVYIIHFWDVMNGLTTSLMRWNPLFWWWNNHIWLSIHPKFHFFGFSPSKTLDFTIKKPRRYPKFSPLSPSQIPFQDISGWLRHCRPRLVPRFAAPHKTPRRRAAHAAQRSAAHLLLGAVVAGRLARGCGGVGGRSHISAPGGKMMKWWGKLLENDGENVVFFLYLGGSRPCKRDGWDEYYVWDGLKATNRGWKLRGSKLRFTWYKMPIRFRSLVDHDWREKLIIFLEVDIIFLHLLGVVMHDKNDEKMLLR